MREGRSCVQWDRAIPFDAVIPVDASADVTGQGLQTPSRARRVGAVIVSDPEESPEAQPDSDPNIVRIATPAPTFNAVVNKRRFLRVRFGGLPRRVGPCYWSWGFPEGHEPVATRRRVRAHSPTGRGVRTDLPNHRLHKVLA